MKQKLYFLLTLFAVSHIASAQGKVDWMRGGFGLNWKPVGLANGGAENVKIDDFLEQIKDLRTVDFIQLHLAESYTSSPVHLASS